MTRHSVIERGEYTYSWRTCAAGGGDHLGHDSTSFGGKYLCPVHLWSLMHGFNPQPYGTPGGTDQTVKFIDGSLPGPMHAERHETVWCVWGRDGEMLTLRPLGRPDCEPITAHVNTVYPAAAGAVYRHASTCGKHPGGAS